MTLARTLFPYRMSASPEPSSADAGVAVTDALGRSLPFVSARVRATAGGGLARIVLEQTFENPHDETLRITYRMPLPADGAVSGYAFEIGARTVTGKVDRKERARERFEEALADGRTAALLDQERADVFTQQIGNVPARATIVARITIDLRLAWLPEGEWELRVPTVIGPRYVVTKEDAAAVGVRVATAGTSARVHLDLVVRDEIEGGAPTSPSHPITTTRGGVTMLRDVGGARLDRDLVVRWRVAKPEASAALVVGRPDDGPHADHAYGLLTVVPPEPRAAKAIPRDLVVLLDTSGSMGGQPLEQGKRVVAQVVSALSADDTLELVEFSDAPRRFAKVALPATEETKTKALAWLRARKAGGATEMEAAVIEALSSLRPGAQRQVVLVTDGYIGGEQRIVTLLHESLPRSCRMHVVGVGSGVNRTLSTSIARAGRGAEVLVGLDEDAERAAKRLVDRTRAPVLTDLVVLGSALVDHAPAHVPDVFAGAPVLAALRLRPEGGTITVRGALAGGAWSKTVEVPRTSPGSGEAAVAALYAREAVADLEVRWTIGSDTAAVDRQIESLGLVFQIATRKTSWVAIDEVRSVDPTKQGVSEDVPQELPYGTTAASFGLEGATATAERDGFATTSTRATAMKGAAPQAMRSRGAPMPPKAARVPSPASMGGAPPPSPPSGAAFAVADADADEAEVDALARTSVKKEASSEPRPMPVSEAPPVTPKRRAPRWLAVVLLVLLFLAAFIVWWVSR